MANKKKFSAKNASKADSKWISNAMKSIGSASLETFKEFAPSISSTAGGMASTMKDVRNIVKESKNKSSGLADNKYIKIAKKTVNNAIEDLKSGNLNNTDRGTQELMDSWGLDDGDSGGASFFDDFNMDDEEGGTSFTYVDNSGDSAAHTEAASIRVSNAIGESTQATLLASKATIDAMVSVTEAGLMQSQKIGNQALEHLSNIENTLQSMLAYQQENTTEFYEAALAAFDRIGTKIDEGGSVADEKIKTSDLLTTKGGIDVGKYKQFVKQQFKSMGSDSTFGSMAGLLGDMMSDETMVDMMISNPIGFASKFIIKGITPGLVKGTIENVEETFKDFMPTMLAKLGDWRKSEEAGWMGNLKRAIGQIFGIDLDSKSNFSVAGKVTKDQATFDGVTRNAIVEVIPKYLRESTGYLKAIAENMKIDTKKAKDGVEVFDVENNKYVKLGDIKKSLAKELDNSQKADFRFSEFGSNIAAGGSSFQGKQSESYQKVADNLFALLTRSAKTLTPADMDVENKDSELHKLIEQLEINNKADKKSQAVLVETLKAMREKGLGNDITATQLRSRSTFNATVNSMSDDYDMRNLVAAGITDDTDIDAFIDSQLGNKKANKLRSDAIKAKKKEDAEALKEANKGNKSNSRKSAMQIVQEGFANKEELDDSTRGKSGMNRKNAEIAFQNGSPDNVVDAFAVAGGHVKQGMIKLMQGADSKTVMAEFGAIFTDGMKGLWGSFKDNFISPLGEKLFGKKGEDGYKEEGLLAGSQNKIKEAWHAVTLRLTGKAYTDAEGNVHTEESDGVKSTVSIVKDAMGTIGESIRFRLFGDKDEDEGTKKKPAVVSNLVETLQKGLVGWKNALFGEDEEDVEKSVSEIKKKAMEALPEAGAGAIAGGLVGGVAGGSLLGTLIGGPVGGAIVGIGASFLKRSTAFQDYVFGPEVKDENGNASRIGGIVSKKTQDLLKDPAVMKNLVGGGAIGLLKNVVLGSSGGVLGAVVGGPVAGMAMGAGLGLLKRSEMFQTFLYGDPEKGKTGLIQHFKNIFKGGQSGDDDQETKDTKKVLGMTAIGAGGGALTAALVGKVGLMGAMLTPAGPLGGALLGAAVGIGAGSKRFQHWLFGEKDEETGKRKGGMVQKLGNFMHVEVMMPLKDKMLDIGADMKNVIEHKIFDTVRITIEPIGNAIKGALGDAKDMIFSKIKDMGREVREQVMQPFLTLMSNMLAPVKKAMSFVTKAAVSATKAVITAPFRLMKATAKIITSPFVKLAKTLNEKFVKPLIKTTAGIIKSITGKVFKIVTAPLKFAAAATTIARQKVGDKLAGVGKNRKDKEYEDDGHFRSESKRSEKEYRDQKKRNRQEARERANMSKNRKEMAKILGYDAKYFTEENYQLALRSAKEQGKKARFTSKNAKNLNFEDDPMQVALNAAKKLKGTSTDDLTTSDSKDESIEMRSLQEEARMRIGIDTLVAHFTGKSTPWSKAKKADKKKDDDDDNDNDATQDDDSEESGDKRTSTEKLVDEMNSAGGVLKWVKNKITGVDENGEGGRFAGIKGKFNNIKNFFGKNAKADGGPVSKGKPYLVGDGGKDPSAAEIVVPKTSGTVLSQKGNGIKVFIEGFSNKFKSFFGDMGEKIKSSTENVAKSLSGAGLKDDSNAFGGIDLKSMDPASRKAVYRNAKKRGIDIGHLSDDTIDAEKKKKAALDSKATAEEKKKKASYEGQQATKQAALEKMEEKNMMQRVVDATESTAETQKKSLWNWLKIFGKGGLIVAALVKLYPAIKNTLNFFSGPLSNLVNNIKSSIDFGLGALEDGAGFIENIGAQVTKIVDPIVGFFKNPKSIFKQMKSIVFGENKDGNGEETDYSTSSYINYGRSKVAGVMNKGKKLYNAFNIVTGRTEKVNQKKKDKLTRKTQNRKDNLRDKMNKVRDEFSKDKVDDVAADATQKATQETTEKVGAEIVETGAKEGAEKVTQKVGAEVVETVAEEGAEKVTKKVTSEAAETAVKKSQKGMLNKVLGFIDDAIEFLFKKCGKKLAEKGAKEGGEAALKKGAKSGLKKVLSKVSGVLVKHFPKIAPKIAALVGAAGALTATGVGALVQLGKTVGWAGFSALNELSNPRRLFQIPADQKPDWIMCVIAAVVGALKGLDPAGPAVDIVDSLVASVLGMSFITEISVFMYECICNFLGMGDKVTKLTESREKQKDNYNKYADKKDKQEYKSYLKAQGKSEEEYSYDQYQQDVQAGKVKGGSKDSFIDYNAKQNKTMGNKALDVVLDVGKSIGEFGTKLMGTDEEGYYDPSTKLFYFPTKTKGIWEMFTSTKVDNKGNPTGEMKSQGQIREENMPDKSTMTKVKITHKGLKDVIDVVKDKANDLKNKAGNWVKDKAKNVGDFIGSSAKAVFNSAKDTAKKAGDVVKNAAKSVKSFLFGNKETVWYDTDGSYYKMTKQTVTHYSGSGDKIGTLSKEDFEVIVKSGRLKMGTKEVSAPGWKKFTKKIGEKMSKGWDKAKDAIGGMWNKFTKTAGGIADEIKEKGVAGFVKGLFTTKKDKVWYDQKKCYYKLEKDGTYSYYSPNNDVIKEKISAEKFEELVSSGSLKQGDLETDSVASNALKAIGDTMKDGWNKAKDTVKNAWDGFKGFLGFGGAGGSDGIDPKNKNGGNGGFGSQMNSIRSMMSDMADMQGGFGSEDANGFPYYSQKDPRWANMDYSSNDSKGTMSDAGCGPTAMAMVASKYSKDKTTPVDLAKDAKNSGFRDETGTNNRFIDAESSKLGLSVDKRVRPDADYILNNVGNGKSMILNGVKTADGSAFTRAGHYVVAVGKDANGNIIVNDPRGKQYSKAIPASKIAKESRLGWSYSGNGGYGGSIVQSIYNKIGGKGEDTFTAEDVIKIATGEIGYLEKNSASNLNDKTKGAGSGNYTKYAKEVGHSNGLPWCATFVCWCFYQAANKNATKAKKVLCNAYTAGCAANVQAFKSAKQWIEPKETPKAGDVIFYTHSHTGIVTDCKDGVIYTVEGNTGGGNDYERNGGCVYKKERKVGDSKILGFGRPKYDGTSSYKGGADSSSSSSSATTDSSTDVLSQVGDIFSQYASKATTGVLTGNWDTSISLDSSSDSSSSDSSSSSSSDISAANLKGSDTVEKVWNYFTGKGYSEAATAGILGNLHQESGVNPASIQNNGKGPAAGIAQWENMTEKSGRWKNMYDYAKKKGKDWKSLEPQLEWMQKELSDKNLDYYFKNDIKYGGSIAGSTHANAGSKPTTIADWKKSNDVDMATRQFEAGYERAGKPMMDQRVSYAKGYYEKYKGSGGKGGFGDFLAAGGFGADDEFNIEQMMFGSDNNADIKRTSIGGSGSLFRNEESNSNVTRTLRASRNTKSVSTTNQIEELLGTVCELLESIDSNTLGTKKAISHVQTGSNTTNNVLVSGQGEPSTQKTSTNKTQKLQSNSSSTNASLAAKLARG